MTKIFSIGFQKNITKEQSKDTGMAMVLLLLIVSLALKRQGYIAMALVALAVNMTWPQAYRPIAIVWLGVAHLMGGFVSRILLSVVFFAIVMPVGLVRRLLGKDPLRLRAFRDSSESVMVERKHVFQANDIRKPY